MSALTESLRFRWPPAPTMPRIGRVVCAPDFLGKLVAEASVTVMRRWGAIVASSPIAGGPRQYVSRASTVQLALRGLDAVIEADCRAADRDENLEEDLAKSLDLLAAKGSAGR